MLLKVAVRLSKVGGFRAVPKLWRVWDIFSHIRTIYPINNREGGADLALEIPYPIKAEKCLFSVASVLLVLQTNSTNENGLCSVRAARFKRKSIGVHEKFSGETTFRKIYTCYGWRNGGRFPVGSEWSDGNYVGGLNGVNGLDRKIKNRENVRRSWPRQRKRTRNFRYTSVRFIRSIRYFRLTGGFFFEILKTGRVPKTAFCPVLERLAIVRSAALYV